MTLESPADHGDATLVRRLAGPAPSSGAVLYVHGFNDYFFQRELANAFVAGGLDFYAVDLHRYGRSLRPDQTPNYCASLAEYDADLDAAAAAIIGAGHDSVLLVGHSTGGLVLPLWASRRPSLPVAGLVLNSPFLEFRQPAAVRVLVGAAATAVATRAPLASVPAGVGALYGDSLHRSRRGEWDYDLAWKPSPGFPVRTGWLRAIIAGHRALHAGLDLPVPTLVLCSTRTVVARRFTDDLYRGDAVLDADAIARWSPAVGRHVTVVRVEDAMHDVFLSRKPARDQAYEVLARWQEAWLT